MKAVIHLAVVFAAFVALCNAQCGPGKSCRTGLSYKKHFDEMNCTAVNSTNDAQCCATNYDCAALTERSTSKCTYMGVTYEVNARLPADLQARTPCLSNCTCTATATGVPSWSCVRKTCPVVALKPNCIMLYRAGDCCSNRQTCIKARRDEFRCKIGPQSFRENTTIPTADPCMRCLCLKGFKNKIEEPFCTKMDCGIELTDYDKYMKQGCAPVYKLSKPPTCCPVGWQCLSPGDVVMDAVVTNKSTPLNPNTTCQFGSMKLTDGQSIIPHTFNKHLPSAVSADNYTMRCTCHTSPGLICTLKQKNPLQPSTSVLPENIIPVSVDSSVTSSTVVTSTTTVENKYSRHNSDSNHNSDTTSTTAKTTTPTTNNLVYPNTFDRSSDLVPPSH